METQPTTLPVAELKRLGYFRTSRKHKLAARIDRPDWLDVLAKQLRMTNVDHGLRSLAHHYRVTLSRDHVELVSMDDLLQLEHSSWTTDELGYTYVPAPQDRIAFGAPGIRDPENPCSEFQPGPTSPSARCETDGHYLCDECEHKRPDEEA